MSRSRRRRQKQRQEHLQELSAYFSKLIQQNPAKFHVEWNKRVLSWLGEIQRRSRHLRRPKQVEDSYDSIFAVLSYAERLMASDPEIERMVGLETRSTLLHACAKAVASQLDPQLHKLISRYSSSFPNG